MTHDRRKDPAQEKVYRSFDEYKKAYYPKSSEPAFPNTDDPKEWVDYLVKRSVDILKNTSSTHFKKS